MADNADQSAGDPTITPPAGSDIEEFKRKMLVLHHTTFGAQIVPIENHPHHAFKVTATEHHIDDYKDIASSGLDLVVRHDGGVEIHGNEKQQEASILLMLETARKEWGGVCHISEGNDDFILKVRDLAAKYGYGGDDGLKITVGPQQQVLEVPAAQGHATPQQQFANAAAETGVRAPRRPADVPPPAGVEDIKSLSQVDAIVAQHNADAAATRAANPDRNAFHRKLQEVEVVDLKEHRTIMRLHEKYGDKEFDGQPDKSFAEDLSTFLYDLKFKKNGEMYKKSQEQFAALGAEYGRDVQLMLAPVIDKGFRYANAYDKCFQLETEKVQIGALLAQLLVINPDKELRYGDGAEKKGIGWSREAVYYVQHKDTKEVVAGANHAGYGHNGANSPANPSNYGIFAFVVPKFQNMGIGQRNYNRSDDLLLRDTNALADMPVKEAIAKKGSIERFAEVNKGELQTLKEIGADAAGSRVTPFERTSFLLNKVGYREIDYKAVTGGARYYEPKYDVVNLGKPNEESDGGTEYCGMYVAARKVKVVQDAQGRKRLEFDGGRVPLKEVSIDTAIAQLKNVFAQTFDGVEDKKDRALDLIKALEAARDRGVKSIPTIDAQKHLAANARWEQRYNAIKALIGDKELSTVQVSVAVGAGKGVRAANLGQEELEGAPGTLPRERQRLSLETLYNHGTMSVSNVKKLGAVGQAVIAELEKHGGHTISGRVALKTIIETQIALTPVVAPTVGPRSAGARSRRSSAPSAGRS